MENQMLRSIENEVRNLREIQKYKYTYTYSTSIAVQNNTTRSLTLNISHDAHVLFEQMTGSVIAPSDQNGIRDIDALSDFPLPGAVDAAGALCGFSSAGVSMRITDVGPGRVLQNGYIPLETLLTPGYREQYFVPQPFKYFAKQDTKFKFEFVNRDTATLNTSDATVTLYHYVTITLKGYRYEVLPDLQ